MNAVGATDPRLAGAAADAITTIVADGLGQDGLGLLRRAINEAQAILETGHDPGRLQQVLEDATDRAMTDPEVARIFDRATLLDRLTRWVSLQVTPQYPWSSPRFLVRALPRLAGPLRAWTVTSDAVAARLRDQVVPGQVWLRVDGLADEDWDLLRSYGQYGRRMMGETFRSGRTKGATDPDIDAVARMVSPDMTNKQIWSLMVASGLANGPFWSDDRTYRKTSAAVRRMRARAARLAGSSPGK